MDKIFVSLFDRPPLQGHRFNQQITNVQLPLQLAILDKYVRQITLFSNGNITKFGIIPLRHPHLLWGRWEVNGIRPPVSSSITCWKISDFYMIFPHPHWQGGFPSQPHLMHRMVVSSSGVPLTHGNQTSINQLVGSRKIPTHWFYHDFTMVLPWFCHDFIPGCKCKSTCQYQCLCFQAIQRNQCIFPWHPLANFNHQVRIVTLW